MPCRPVSFMAVVTGLLLASITLSTPRARAADETQALINQALDKQVQFSINAVLPQAMSAIAEKTGVRIEAGPEVYDLLPWGQDTNIKATVQNQTLREALQGITQKLGLTFVLKDQAVELEPTGALRRLARRSTVDELGALDKLAATPLESASTKLTLKDLLDAVDAKLDSTKYALENRSAESVPQSTAVSIARNITLMDALDEMTRQTSATWYPWAKTIVVLSKSDQTRRQLTKSISVRYNGVPLEQVLLELRQHAGVQFDYEPGAIQQVPTESRTIRLVLDNATIQDALDAISGFTGLDYVVRDDMVYFWNPTGNTAGARERVGILLQLDSGTQVVVPQSQIPQDVREFIAAKTQDEIRKLRNQMKAEGFKPASASTHPTTAAANPDL